MSINGELTKEEAIEKLINEFNFETVHIALKALDWQWYEFKAVPSIEQLKNYARQLLYDSYDNGVIGISSTTGFVTQLIKGREDCLNLKYNLCTSSVFYTNKNNNNEGINGAS